MEQILIRRVLRLFWPHRWRFLWIILFALISAVLSSLPPLMMKWMVDSAFPSKDYQLWLLAVLGMALFPLLGGLFGVWQNHWNNQVGLRIMAQLRERLFERLQKQSILFFTHTRSGEIVSRFMSDVDALQDVLNKLIMNGLMQSLILLSSAVILCWMDVPLALIALGVLPLLIWPMKKVGKIRKGLKSQSQRDKGEMSALISEWFGVSGAYTSRAYGLEKQQAQQFLQLNESVTQHELKLQWVGRWFFMTMGIMGPLGAALIYAYGGFGVMMDRLTIGELVAFAAYMARLYAPVSQLMNLHVEWTTGVAVFQRLFDYLDLQDGLKECENPRPLQVVKGKMIANHVSFRYREEHLIHDFSMVIEAGKNVAIVGESGAGKSTVLSLLARLVDPQKGQVLLDDLDLRDVSLAALRTEVTIVAQDSFLFAGSIAENLRLAKPEATDEELERILDAVALTTLIKQLPDGLATKVGERGYRMSGGERQRIALARALLRNPIVLMLDESTSHLDALTETIVLQNIHRMREGKTTIWVAHRLSTVQAADQIYVMSAGKIAEHGTHDELMHRDGVYAELVRAQVLFSTDERTEAQT